jgi:hypothetical protein
MTIYVWKAFTGKISHLKGLLGMGKIIISIGLALVLTDIFKMIVYYKKLLSSEY